MKPYFINIIQFKEQKVSVSTFWIYAISFSLN